MGHSSMAAEEGSKTDRTKKADREGKRQRKEGAVRECREEGKSQDQATTYIVSTAAGRRHNGGQPARRNFGLNERQIKTGSRVALGQRRVREQGPFETENDTEAVSGGSGGPAGHGADGERGSGAVTK